MKKLVLVEISPSPVQPPEPPPAQQQPSPRWQVALICCALAYVLCILVTTAPLHSIVGLQTQFWISNAIVVLDNWLHLPHDLGFSTDHYVSQPDTYYLELLLPVLLAFAAYGLYAYLLQRTGPRSNHTFALRLIWFTTIVSGCIYLLTPASLSDDVYGYASYGRLLSVHHANPYVIAPSAFPQDPTYPLIHWKDAFAPYGPVWIVLSAAVGLISGPDRLGYLVAFRLCAFAAHLLNIWLVTATLRTMGRSARTVALGTLLYAWNPLVLLESSAGGHNDVFMLTFILLGLLLSARAERKGPPRPQSEGKPRPYSILALVAFTLAGLVKLTAFPILAFPVLKLCWNTYKATTPTTRTGSIHRWGIALLAGLLASMGSIAVALASYAPFWLGHSIQQIMFSFSSQPTENYAFNSFLAAISVWQRAHGLPAFLGLFNSHPTWNAITVAAIALSVGLGAIWLWRASTTRTVALAALATLAAFLLVTPWFTDWYVTWLVGLAAVCLPVAHDRLGRSLFVLALTFSASAFLTYYYVSIGHLLLVLYPNNISWFALECFATFGIPVVAFLLSWVSQ
jgi:Glycosyltransferase family 87